MIHSLESRRMLAASVYVTGSTLRIEADDAPETVALALNSQTQAKVVVDGTDVLTFDLSVVRTVSYNGAGGNDNFIMGRVVLRAFVNGGPGADSISTSSVGAANDTVSGGIGDDYVFAGPGNDTLAGSVGDDQLMGGDGDDVIRILSDDDGDDTVIGGNGIDTYDATNYFEGTVIVVGDRNPNPIEVSDVVYEDVEVLRCTGYQDNIAVVSGRPVTVFLGDGRDTFTGGSGNDTVYGQAKQDEIFGAGGDDIFYISGDGATDVVIGGSGNDTAYADAFDVLDSTIEKSE